MLFFNDLIGSTVYFISCKQSAIALCFTPFSNLQFVLIIGFKSTMVRTSFTDQYFQGIQEEIAGECFSYYVEKRRGADFQGGWNKKISVHAVGWKCH